MNNLVLRQYVNLIYLNVSDCLSKYGGFETNQKIITPDHNIYAQFSSVARDSRAL